MAKKAPKAKDYEVPSDIMDKANAYADRLGIDVDHVIEVALRDWFHDIDAGKRPRSMSDLESVA